MILTCSSCSTRYYADDTAIGPNGRTVRCASCGHEWFAEPHLTLVAEEAKDRPEPLTRERVERMRRAGQEHGPAPSAAARYRQQQQDRMKRERQRVAVVAWGATGAALAASAAGAVTFRQDVAEIWPRSASAYAAVGLDVNVYGLEFENLSVERGFEGATPILIVSGEVHNIGRDDKAAPPVRITLRDGESRELYESVHALETGMVRAGARAPFELRLANPPVDAVDLEASFASDAEAAQPRALTTRASSPAEAPHAAPLVLDGEAAAAAAAHPPEPPALRLTPTAAAAPIDGLAPRFSTEAFGERG